MATAHGNIKSYLHKYKISDSPMCCCKSREQTAEPHIVWLQTARARKRQSKICSIADRKRASEWKQTH